MRYIKLLFISMISLASCWINPTISHIPKHGNPLFVSMEPTIQTTSMFGELEPILLPGESFLGSMGVPTYAESPKHLFFSDDIVGSVDISKARHLEGVLNHGPSLMVDSVLTAEACEKMIDDCNSLVKPYDSGKNHHGALQILVSQEMTDAVAKRLSSHIDVAQVESLRKEMIQGTGQQIEEEDVRLVFAGLNRRWRIYKYESNGIETFAPHIDAGFPPSALSEDGSTLLWDASEQDDDEIVSRLTVLMYLNDDFVGGETNFYGKNSGSQASQLIASVRPVQGSCLLFPQGVGEEAVEYARQHWPLHEGSPVTSGRPKYVIRSDALFVTQKEPLLLDDKLFQYDHLVRGTFLPTSSAIQKTFLAHTMSLYNPHMGVENLGPLLYSLIKFTKKRKILEIGAGYTTLFILKALQENDEELERIWTLQESGKCRLLNYDWTVSESVQDMAKESASLLCIDNCEHQKETATGASAVAKSLGLDSYLNFMKGDAFELEIEVNSIDILWCDFGVGSRMHEFVASAWKSIRPGGFLLCHSTLTNQNTREWLEAVRSRRGQDITGIPPDEYSEVSLLEPHKRFQNSITLLQKRKDSETGAQYEEPLYSKFA